MDGDSFTFLKLDSLTGEWRLHFWIPDDDGDYDHHHRNYFLMLSGILSMNILFSTSRSAL
jgi:hypothetical protein